MTGKTKKDLEAELVQLKQLLVENKSSLETLQMKYDTLEKKLDENTAPKKNVFICEKCEENFESFREMRNHVRKHRTKDDSLKCNECDRFFNEEWKLNAHKKNHHKHSCDRCDKTFKCEELKQKHIGIAHENLQLFCHFSTIEACTDVPSRGVVGLGLKTVGPGLEYPNALGLGR